MGTTVESLSDEIKRRRDHNSSVPVGNLSPDVLLKIMWLVGPSEGELYDDASQNFRYCSQVCHNWRIFTLSDPLLWSSSISWLDFRQGVEWTLELLHRSGPESNLSVGIWLRNTPKSEIEFNKGHADSMETSLTNIELLSQCLPQIKDLKFYFDDGCELQVFQEAWYSFCTLSAPNLLSLTLGDKRRYPDDMNYFTWNPEVFGGLGAACPNLKHLHLFNCTLNIKSPLYRQLTTLHVSNISAGAHAPTALEWLTAIKMCKSLVSWSYEGYIPESKPISYRASEETVSLPALAHLQLHLSYLNAITLLSAFQCPSLRTFDVIVFGILPTSTEFQILSDIMRRYIDGFLPTLKPSLWHMSFVDDSGIRLAKEQKDSSGRTTFSIQYSLGQVGLLHLIKMPFAISTLLSTLMPYGIAEMEQLTLYIIQAKKPPFIPPLDRLVAALSPFQSVTALRFACYQAERAVLFSARDSFFTPHCPSGIDEHISRYNSFLTTPSPLTLLPRLSYLYVQPVTPLDTLKEIIVQRMELDLPIKTIQFSDLRGDVVHTQSDLPSKEELEELTDFGLNVIIDDDILKVLKD